MKRLVQAWAMNSNVLRFWRRRQSPRELRAGRRGGWAPPRFQPAARSPQRLAPPRRDWGCVASEQGARRPRGSQAGTMGASCGLSARRLSPAACHGVGDLEHSSARGQPQRAAHCEVLLKKLTRRGWLVGTETELVVSEGWAQRREALGWPLRGIFFFWR